jgi:hypothetical protein
MASALTDSVENGPMTRSDRVATLEEAKAQFQKSWDEWKASAKPGGDAQETDQSGVQLNFAQRYRVAKKLMKSYATFGCFFPLR